MSVKWHPDKNPNVDVTRFMQDINEAYAILKNEEKRKRYDIEYDNFFKKFAQNCSEQFASSSSSAKAYAYHYDVQDEKLKEDIAVARQDAEKIVEEFLKSFKEASQNAIKGAWKGASSYLIGAIIASIIFVFIRMCH